MEFFQHKNGQKDLRKKKIYRDFHSHSVDTTSSYVFVIILRIILTFFHIDASLHFSGDNVCGTNDVALKQSKYQKGI